MLALTLATTAFFSTTIQGSFSFWTSGIAVLLFCLFVVIEIFKAVKEGFIDNS